MTAAGGTSASTEAAFSLSRNAPNSAIVVMRGAGNTDTHLGRYLPPVATGSPGIRPLVRGVTPGTVIVGGQVDHRAMNTFAVRTRPRPAGALDENSILAGQSDVGGPRRESHPPDSCVAELQGAEPRPIAAGQSYISSLRQSRLHDILITNGQTRCRVHSRQELVGQTGIAHVTVLVAFNPWPVRAFSRSVSKREEPGSQFALESRFFW